MWQLGKVRALELKTGKQGVNDRWSGRVVWTMMYGQTYKKKHTRHWGGTQSSVTFSTDMMMMMMRWYLYLQWSLYLHWSYGELPKAGGHRVAAVVSELWLCRNGHSHEEGQIYISVKKAMYEGQIFVWVFMPQRGSKLCTGTSLKSKDSLSCH